MNKDMRAEHPALLDAGVVPPKSLAAKENNSTLTIDSAKKRKGPLPLVGAMVNPPTGEGIQRWTSVLWMESSHIQGAAVIPRAPQ